jgi:hypothetical protein
MLRLRQYLHASDGSCGYYMPVMAEAVSGFVHVSLFLSFVGLGDFVLDDNQHGRWNHYPHPHPHLRANLLFFTKYAPAIGCIHRDRPRRRNRCWLEILPRDARHCQMARCCRFSRLTARMRAVCPDLITAGQPTCFPAMLGISVARTREKPQRVGSTPGRTVLSGMLACLRTPY